MSLEGLQFILEKREVVPTVGARDLIDRAAQVEADYRQHVRTYVPMSRVAGSGDEAISVDEFERRLIKQVKEGRAPRGYITAGYGYGKTTTALYLWERAQAANIVVVPPFQMEKLLDLVDGLYGWLRHVLSHSRPALVDELTQIYDSVINRSLDRMAMERSIAFDALQGMLQDGYLTLDIQPAQFIDYFTKATNIALSAGFDGVVMLPDEIQQFVRQNLGQSAERIASFFNVIQLLNTRAASGNLKFGFILVITQEELGLIRDNFKRGDLLHRMKDLTINLTYIYDQHFAPNLWAQFAKQFNFVDVAEKVVAQETLEALGQISARADISDGPRTVVNVFRRMVQLYLERNQYAERRYTPIDLIDDFLDEQRIQFGGNDKLRSVTRRALQAPIVRRDPERYGKAIKLAAAFPTEGVPRKLQEQYHTAEATDELMREAIGDLVRSGSLEKGSVALVGLDQVVVKTDWLPNTVREFRLGYREDSPITKERAVEAFSGLLKNRVFKGWKVVYEREANFTSNHAIVLEGAFDSVKSRFPRRKLHVRIFWEDEPRKDAFIDGDVCIEYHLKMHMDMDQTTRREHAETVEIDTANRLAIVPLNLLYMRSEGVTAGIQDQLRDVWSPYDLSPLVLMNIYQLLEEKRERHEIPKRDDALIKSAFQPELMDNVMRDLFNARVGQSLEAAGIEITDLAVGLLLEARYPDYDTLMIVSNWQASIKKYITALKSLDTPLHKRGEIDLEEAKDKVAGRFVLTNTGFDSFHRTFEKFIKIKQDFSGQKSGVVQFTLHPLETLFMERLRAGEKVKDGSRELRRVSRASLEREARQLGYQDEELNHLFDVMVARDLIEIRQDWVVEQARDIITTHELVQLLDQTERDLAALQVGFSSSQLTDWAAKLEAIRANLRSSSHVALDQKMLLSIRSTLRTRAGDLEKFAHDRQQELRDRLKSLQTIHTISDKTLHDLAQPFKGEVTYVDQVNVLRSELEKQAVKVKSAVDKLKQELDEASQKLQQSSLPYNELAAYNSRLTDDYTVRARQVTELSMRFEEQYKQLDAWRTLITQGAKTAQELSLMNPDQIRTLLEAFDLLQRDIRAEISSKSNKLQALDYVVGFKQRLDEIETQLTTRRNAERRQFEQLQMLYRHALTSRGIARDGELANVVFNPADPSDSRRRLIEMIQTRLRIRWEEWTKSLSRVRATLLAVQNVFDRIAASKRSQIEESVSHGLKDVDDLQKHLHVLDTETQHTRVIQAFTDGDKGFEELADQFKKVAVLLEELQQRAREVQKEIDIWKLDPQEQKALDQLRQLSSGDEVDFVEWQRKLGDERDTLWNWMRSLVEKDRIQVTIRIKGNSV